MRTNSSSIARPSRAAALALILIAQAFAASVQAIPGDLDRTFARFGTGGKINAAGSGILALKPDGRILWASHAAGQISVYCYLPDGTPDPSFSGDGVATFSLPGVAPYVHCIAVQPDGKVLVGGMNGGGQDDFLVVRLTAAGALDPTFGVNGFTYTDIFGNHFDRAHALLVQPDGKIVAAGSWDEVGGDAAQFAVARYNANGSLDLSFAGTGKRRIALNTVSACLDVARQADGKLVFAGYTLVGPGDYDFGVARLNADGSIDNTFDGNGVLSTGIGGQDFAGAVAIQPDGRIVVAGGNQPGGTADGEIVRYLTNGALDTSFDGDGKRILPGLTGNALECDVEIQPDGKILYLDTLDDGGNHKFALYRMSSNGAFDISFGVGGRVLIDFQTGGRAMERGTALALRPDGRILAMGVSSGVHIAQLWPDGSLDLGGQQACDFIDQAFDTPQSNEVGFGMALQSDDKVVIAGDVSNTAGTSRDFAITRFLPDGQIDAAFGGSAANPGRVILGNAGADETATGVVIQPDGKIVVAGYSVISSGSNFMVARFNTNGTPDASFGFGGYNVIDFLGGDDFGMDVALAPDGKIVVAGMAFNGARTVFGVARFNTNGTVDNTFDGDGRKLYEASTSLTHTGHAVVVQSDRKIVMGGQIGTNFGVVRFNENGSVDGSFGGLGRVLIDLGGADDLHALALQGDGKILAAGSRVISGNSDFAIVRITPGGALDAPFGSGGAKFVDMGADDQAWAIALRSDGGFVVAGCSNSRFAVVQFLGNGALDTGFFGTGYNHTDFVGTQDCAWGVAIADDGVVLGGYVFVSGHYNMALARFEPTLGTVDVAPSSAPAGLAITRLSPNPARGETRIDFELPRAAHVRVGVYDALGRRVASPVDGLRAAGRHSTAWTPPRSVAAGIYFVRFEAAGLSASRRLVVLP